MPVTMEHPALPPPPKCQCRPRLGDLVASPSRRRPDESLQLHAALQSVPSRSIPRGVFSHMAGRPAGRWRPCPPGTAGAEQKGRLGGLRRATPTRRPGESGRRHRRRGEVHLAARPASREQEPLRWPLDPAESQGCRSGAGPIVAPANASRTTSQGAARTATAEEGHHDPGTRAASGRRRTSPREHHASGVRDWRRGIYAGNPGRGGWGRVGASGWSTSPMWASLAGAAVPDDYHHTRRAVGHQPGLPPLKRSREWHGTPLSQAEVAGILQGPAALG